MMEFYRNHTIMKTEKRKERNHEKTKKMDGNGAGGDFDDEYECGGDGSGAPGAGQCARRGAGHGQPDLRGLGGGLPGLPGGDAAGILTV